MEQRIKQGNYCLGLDLGANSIGWAVLSLDADGQPNGIVRMGVRLFPDGRNPKDKQSLATMRRGPRQARRRRDRYLKRRSRLFNTLVEAGLMPATTDEQKAVERLNPFELRATALDRPLTPYELGRALFHLNQRRGFKSNRKADKGDDKESGKIASGNLALSTAIAESSARTLGEYLNQRNLKRQTVRARLRGEGAKATYELYLHRDMIAQEFDAIWAAQQAFHPALLTDRLREQLRDTLLFQRPLLPVKAGVCTFNPNDIRLPRAHPITQQLRIYQELNHLRIAGPGQPERPLTLAERDELAAQLLAKKEVSFAAIRKAAGDRNAYINLESSRREKLLGDETAALLGDAKRFGPMWRAFNLADQTAIVELLLKESDARVVIETLMSRYGIDMEAANRISQVHLPEGYGRIGLTAGTAILAALKAEVITYDKACKAAGYDHAKSYSGEVHSELPYYAEALPQYVGHHTSDPADSIEVRFGRIANPTVHIGLNQLRRVVNKIIARYGHPRQIAVEVTRELKLGPEKVRELEKQQTENQKRNEGFKAEIIAAGYVVTGESLQRMRLWHELPPVDRCCIYTGEHISIERLLSPEGQIEIDHILPFSRTLDDSIANKVLCVRRANRDKSGQSPYEAFGHSPEGYDWQAILARAQNLHVSSRKRFAPDAMEKFAGQNDFLARHLTDTAYLSRVAGEYLSLICPPAQIRRNPGQLTALLRGKWGLNKLLSDADSKNRNDQRHHAIDAVVVGVTTRRMLQQVATASGRSRQQGVNRLIENMPEPWPEFHQALRFAVNRVVVSYKPDHGPESALHNDTAYGIVETKADGKSVVRHRVPIDSFTKAADLEDIVDPSLRSRLQHVTEGCATAKDFKQALTTFRERTCIRRVRIEETLTVIGIRNQAGEIYKAYKGDGNYCYEIFRSDKGRWEGEVITSFAANQKGYRAFREDKSRFHSQAFCGKPLVMRLMKDDVVAIEEDGERRLMRVVKLSEGKIALAEHFQGGSLKGRNDDPSDKFSYLTKAPSGLSQIYARRAFIDELGYVKDPGFRP